MVDLSPIMELLLSTVALVLMAVGSYAVQRFTSKLEVDKDSQLNAILNDALEHAVDYAILSARRRGDKLSSYPVRNEAVANAVTYVVEGVPGILKHFDVTPERLAKMVEARLWGLDDDVITTTKGAS